MLKMALILLGQNKMIYQVKDQAEAQQEVVEDMVAMVEMDIQTIKMVFIMVEVVEDMELMVEKQRQIVVAEVAEDMENLQKVEMEEEAVELMGLVEIL